MISTASTRILATTLLVGFLPCVKADCWRNWSVFLSHTVKAAFHQLDLFFFSSHHIRDGSRICNGLGNLARVMFGLAGRVYRPHCPRLPPY